MNKRAFISIGIAAFICCNAFSQGYMNNWVFGDSIGLNFSTGEPAFFDTHITAFEATASISDSLGNILFYSDGEEVWDRNNNRMPNGDSLEIGRIQPGFGSSVSQGMVICPKPGAEDYYYLIYLSEKEIVSGYLQLKYSLVNMELNSGLGDVVIKNENLTFDEPFWEGMQIVKHGNGIDYWVILISNSLEEDEPIFWKTWLVTNSGIEGPFTQDYGDNYELGDGPFQAIGQMKFSLDGSKLTNGRGNDLDVFNFDRCNGQFSNYINIDTVCPYPTALYGIEYSSDGSKLYTMSFGNTGDAFLYQFCYDCGMEISDTKTTIYKGEFNHMSLQSLQLAVNNKIYFDGDLNDNTISNLNKYLYVINDPNNIA